MRRVRFVLAMLLVAGMVGMVQAQGGGRGMFGGPSFLVSSTAVQDELKLSDDQKEKLKEWTKDFREKSREMMKEEGIDFKGGFGKMSEEMAAKMETANSKISKEAYKQLSDVLKKEQLERLKQIDRQVMGLRAFSDAEVAAALKLTDSQKSTIKGISGDLQKESQEIMADVRGKGKFDLEKLQDAQKKVQKLQKEAEGKIEEILEADQKKTWKAMTGEPFDRTKLFQFPKKDTKKD